MSEPNRSLAKPLTGMSDAEKQALIDARAHVYGIGHDPDTATAAQRALVLQHQYATTAERDAARNGQTTPPRGRTPAPRTPASGDTPPPATERVAASELTLRDAQLMTLYRGLDERLMRSGESLLTLARADAAKAEGVARTHTDEEYRTLVARNVQLRTRLATEFAKIDEQIAANPSQRAELLEGITEFSQGFGGQIDSLNNTSNPNDPFDADKFFDGIEPTLREMSTAVGRMTRSTVDATVTGLKALGSALLHPRRAAGNIAADAREAGGNFMERLNPGSIGGGLLGAAGGFAISSIFGPGPLKYLLMLLLIPGGMMLGATKLDGPLNNMFGGIFGRRNAEGGNAPDQSQATPAQGVEREQDRDAFANVNQLSPEDLRRARVAVPSSVAGSVHAVPNDENSMQTIYEAGYARGLRVYPSAGRAPYSPEGDSAQAIYEGGRAAERNRDDRSAIDIRSNGVSLTTEDGRRLNYRQYTNSDRITIR